MKIRRHPNWLDWISCLYALLLSTSFATAQEASQATVPAPVASGETELQARWEYFAPVPLPKLLVPGEPANDSVGNNPVLVEFILGPSVFSHARADLADLRLYDSSGVAIPYALRYLRPQSVRNRVLTQEFNRTEPKDGPLELSLELRGDDVQNNELEVVTSGEEFRRLVVIEVSDDGKIWRPLAKAFVLRYARGDQRINLQSITYPASRARYVRVRITADEGQEKDEFKLLEVNIWQRIEVPGEVAMFPGQLGAREPVRSPNGPASAWLIDFGGDNVPCDRLELDVADAEFARDVRLEMEFPIGPNRQAVFSSVRLTSESTWQRRAGQRQRPMFVKFDEVQTRRMKLTVTDHRNPPLNIRSVKFGAPARQVVFAEPTAESGAARLYFGNPLAEATNYDFARNLPTKLEPLPTRTSLGEVERNPHFVPPPQPFTERFPWLIYAVLALVTLFLAGVILSLARSAIAIHDGASSTKDQQGALL